MNGSTTPALSGSSNPLKGIIPDGDAIAPLLVMAYAAFESYGIDLPAFDLSGDAGMAPILVLGGGLFFAARFLVKKRFDALEQQNRVIEKQLLLQSSQLRALLDRRSPIGTSVLPHADPG